MDKKYEISKKSEDLNRRKNFSKFINSDSYDEMKFIDDWISYAEEYKNKKQSNFDKSHPFTENKMPEIKLEDESSYSSVMDLYMNESTKYAAYSEVTDEESSKSSLETIDLCDKSNIAMDLFLSNSEDKENKIDQQVNTSVEYESSSRPIKKLQVFLKDSPKQDFSSIKINKVQHPTLVNLQPYNRSVCSRQVKLSKHKLIMPDKKIVIPRRGENESPYESELTGPIRTMDLLREAEKRTIQQNKRTTNDVPLRRFVIGIEEVQIKMDDVFTLHDLKTKVIIGQLSKRGNNGYYQKNWFVLRENFFSCFNGKKLRISPNTMPQERLGDIPHPEDPLSFITKKYTLDLLNCRLLLCKKKGRKDILTCYSEGIPAESDLIDVTELIISNIQESLTGYKVILQKDNQRAEITLSCLNFCIKNNDGYRFYKPDTIDDFLKWIIAFRFRLGQIELNIGF